jgi:hypothetical protein
MNQAPKISVFALFLTIVASASIAQAQVRDAGSKIRGDYFPFERQQISGLFSTNSFDTTGGSRVVSSSPSTTESVRNAPTGPRSFSFDRAQPRTNRAADQSSTQPVRLYSYQPALMVANRPATTGNWSPRPVFRDAGSKIRGDY